MAGLQLLGEPLPTGEQANFRLLEEVVRSFRAENPSGGKRSKDIYCGLVAAEEGFAGSKTTQKGAWITVGTQCIDLTVMVAAIAQVWPKLLRWLLERGAVDAQNGLEGARGSMFRFVGFDFPGDHHEYEDDSDVWGSELASSSATNDAESMIRWVVGHEISHLLQGDDVTPDNELRSARALECARILGPMWPTSNEHQMELIADYGAVQYLGAAATSSIELLQLARGSFLETLAVCFESWFIDQSAVSSSHPSPFLRAEALLGIWLDFLERQVRDRNPIVASYDPLSVTQVVEATILISLVAGRYGSHRDGIGGLVADYAEVRQMLVSVLRD